jgi:cytochrome P450
LEPYGALELIRRARRNLLEIWTEKAFQAQFMQTRLLAKKVFICNFPDTVQHAFSTHNSSFERKSPQMRHALQPLLGDGLFISDGEIWRRRRKVVAPIIHVSRLGEFAPSWSTPSSRRVTAGKRRATRPKSMLCPKWRS